MVGVAVYTTEATRMTDEMFIVAATAVAEQVTDKELATGLIYPPQSQIPNASLLVAERGAAHIFDNALVGMPRSDYAGASMRARTSNPVCLE
jgi:malate dehydrogenase (oxaloacetate-decarboxylating)(NADP+)